MNKKILISSVFAAILSSPAWAVSFPTGATYNGTIANGLMQKNTTYENAAIQTNMGITTGTTTAEAYYDIAPGYYLKANEYTVSACPSNSYCSGASGVTFNASSNQGITNTCPSEYPRSGVYSTSINDCYRNCTLADVATQNPNAAGVEGKYFYGSVNNCFATNCTTGYHSVGDVTETTIRQNLLSQQSGTSYKAVSESGQETAGSDVYTGQTINLANGQWLIAGTTSSNVYALVGNSQCSSETGATASGTSLTPGNNCYCSLDTWYDASGATLLVFTTWYKSAYAPGQYDTPSSCQDACSELCAMNASGMDAGANLAMIENAHSAIECEPNTYTVTYACGTGANGTANHSDTATYNATYSLWSMSTATTRCDRTGYHVSGYSVSATDPERVVSSSFKWEYASGKTLTAQWTANTYTVSFNANSGTGGQSANVTATYDAAMPAISTTAPTRTGYTFKGWYDNATYTSGSQYYTAAGASAKSYDKANDSALYAGWQANTYAVSFNANSGTGGQSANVTATYDAAMPAISTTAPTRAGYIFKGWYDNADYTAGTQYYTAAGASAKSYNKASATTLYAGWQANALTIRWTGVSKDKNGTSVSGGVWVDDSVTYGGDIVTPRTPLVAPAGQTFVGWKFVNPNNN